MDNLKNILNDMISDEEQLESLVAMNFGIHNGLNHMFRRLSSYHALLELELEDSPTGKIYLQEGDIALRVAFELLKTLDSALDVHRREFESIDLQALVKGVARRLKKIGQSELEIDFSQVKNRDIFVWGKLHLLQQIFFELPSMFHTDTPYESRKLYVKARVETFDDEFFKSCKSILAGGEYTVLQISKSDRDLENHELVGLFEKQIISPNLELADSFVMQYGTVLLHSGDLLCSKKDNELASVVLLFPVRRNQVAMYEEQSMDEDMLQGSETILLVDDEGIIWDVVIEMLQTLGYTVLLAANGKDCVEIYESNQKEIDLILLDMVMPEMNGHDAFFALKELDPEVNVLLSSGYVEEEDARDVLEAGAAAFLRKPYRMVDLAKAIRDAVETKKRQKTPAD